MDKKQLEDIFTYHPPFGNQATRYEQIRAKAKELALLINDACPESREKSLAITHCQSVVWCANAAIAIHEKPE